MNSFFWIADVEMVSVVEKTVGSTESIGVTFSLPAVLGSASLDWQEPKSNPVDIQNNRNRKRVLVVLISVCLEKQM